MKFTGPDDLKKIYDETRDTFPNTQLWWRGHASCNYELKPSVYRRSVYGDNERTFYEKSVTLHFKTRAPGLYPNCPTDDDNIGWLFLMQHYGLPTRLLDWTSSLLVGLLFAVQDPKDRQGTPKRSPTGELFVLDPTRLNERHKERREVIVDIKGNKLAERTARRAFIGKQELKLKPNLRCSPILAIAPPHRDDRMVAQQAYSTLHGTTEALDQLPNKDDFLLKIEIQPDAKKATRPFLHTLGIKKSVLFPDLEHLAKELKGADYRSM